MMMIARCIILLGVMAATAYGHPVLGETCSGTWSECAGFPLVVCRGSPTPMCQCRWSGYEVEDGPTIVCKEGSLDDLCNDDDNCDTSDATCRHIVSNQPDVCTCPDRYYPADQDCVAGIPGDRCDPAKDQCILEDAECTGDTGETTCACPAGSYAIQACYDGSMGDPCKINENCMGDNDLCLSGVCACPADRYGVDGNCFLGDLTDECNNDENCVTVNAQCIGGVCTCPGENPYDIDDTCYTGSQGDKCIDDTDCSDTVHDSECRGTPLTCQCPENWFFSDTACYEQPLEGPQK